MWHSGITVVSLHQQYNTYNTWFLDVRIYQLVYCRDQSLLQFLNQARASRRPVRAWFLEIAFVREVGMCVCVCVCVCPRGYKLHSHDIEPLQPAEQVCCV